MLFVMNGLFAAMLCQYYLPLMICKGGIYSRKCSQRCSDSVTVHPRFFSRVTNGALHQICFHTLKKRTTNEKAKRRPAPHLCRPLPPFWVGPPLEPGNHPSQPGSHIHSATSADLKNTCSGWLCRFSWFHEFLIFVEHLRFESVGILVAGLAGATSPGVGAGLVKGSEK